MQKTSPRQGRAAVTKKSPIKKSARNILPAHFMAWWRRRRLWQRIGLGFLAALMLLSSAHLTIEHMWRPVKNPRYGVSFSIKYSQELGLNWRENFLALVNDLKIKNFRLMSYWDLIEPEQGKFNFADLDWQMEQVAKAGGQVTLAIGYRQPRWPECHQPGWASKLTYDSEPWLQALNSYMAQVIDHYKNNPVLQSYQLENEAVNNWFGECPGAAPKSRLKKEFSFVKQYDSAHPVYMSLSDQHGFPLNEPVPDAYGFSLYRLVWNDKGPWHFYVTYPTPVWYHRLRANAIKVFKHRPVFEHELQMEPWGPVPTKNMTVAEQNRSMSVNQIHVNFDFGRRVGMENIYTWGGEWWYWRKVKFNDPGPWEAVRQELNGAYQQ